MGIKIYNFFEARAAFDLVPVQALKHFMAKGLRLSFDWRDLQAEEHELALTVAKMMDSDLLAFVKGETQKAIVQGTTLEEFKEKLIPTLQKAGWWGRQQIIDPLTGETVTAQLGSASRLQTIFRSNLESAYAAGSWQQIQYNLSTAPYLMYDAIEDDRVRPEHLQWNGKVIPVDDIFWKQHFPPNGWNCRCGVVQMSPDEVKHHGLLIYRPEFTTREWQNPRTGLVHNVAKSVDYGWNFNPGTHRKSALLQMLLERENKL